MTEVVKAEAPTPAQQVASAKHGMEMVVDTAVGQAEILQRAIDEQKLASKISGRRYIQVEGWQLVLALNNIVPVIVESKPVEVGDTVGWEAHCELRDGTLTVGSGTGMCLRSEKTWSKRDDYALRSMAETRAIGKACRNRFGFLAKMAGFEATPQEEMQTLQSFEVIAKTHAMAECGGNAEDAKRTYEQALSIVGVDSVETEEVASAVISTISEIVAEAAAFDDAEVVEEADGA